ncbi:MAG: prepilin-type N-terminal cleavage/methylation domain-containing protein [Aquabacterium sp.]|nr:prepilin-type N-terminal cleavage/methylation domain-containing protein [Aquabacterium sp.]
MRRRGFTLVEVLVAVVIMAVMAAMGWQGVSAMVRARDIGAASSDRTLRLSAVIGQWEHDLGAVYDSTVVPGLQFDGASLRLVRRTEGGVQLVVWAVRDGRWQRWPGPVVQRSAALREAWLASQQLQGQEPGQLQLLDGVAGWQLYFWRGQGWSNAQSSADEVANVGAVDNPPAQPPNPAPNGTNPPPGGADGATTGNQGAAPNAPGGTGTGTGTPAPGAGPAAPAPVRNRSLLPTGVRLQLDLPEGRITRDVLLPPTP